MCVPATILPPGNQLKCQTCKPGYWLDENGVCGCAPGQYMAANNVCKQVSTVVLSLRPVQDRVFSFSNGTEAPRTHGMRAQACAARFALCRTLGALSYA